METDLLNQFLEQSGSLLLVSLLISVGCAALCGYLAARRGASRVFWLAMGFAFGPFAIPFVFLAGKPGGEKKQ
jgi:ABC-type dipeptide/oligopeptide/nickel transport system permease component